MGGDCLDQRRFDYTILSTVWGGGALVHNPRSQSPFTIFHNFVNGVHKISKINTSFMLYILDTSFKFF